VERVLSWLRADVVRTMALLGVARIAELDRSYLDLSRASPG
jgi:isopentenyl diphosphate isomerase/L-lactate dehydrogenase-like FMN-dependent dehydrogenase